jgi:hypothetical protein
MTPFWSPDPELELSTDETANLNAYIRKPWAPVKFVLLAEQDDAEVTKLRHSLYDHGYVRLGGVDFQQETHGNPTGGAAEKEQAIAFAHKIGADIVLYRCWADVDSSNRHRAVHHIGFYARKLGNITLTAQP